MATDLEIAKQFKAKPIEEIATKCGISAEKIIPYGKDKAKLSLDLIDESTVQNSNLILVSAITPTPAGEGKTTVSIGLTDALNLIGAPAIAALREPSMGPVFGMKGELQVGAILKYCPWKISICTLQVILLLLKKRIIC